MSNRNHLPHIKLYNTICEYFPSDYTNGTLIEVGAADPVDISVSLLFRPLIEQKRLKAFRQAEEWKSIRPSGQWSIISVEPNPNFCAEFRKMGLEVLEYAACAEDKGQTTFHVSPFPMSSSALEVKYSGDFPIKDGAGGWWAPDTFTTIKVEALTLNTILQRHHPELEHIDLLMVDVEGWEIEVMKGFDIKRYSPKVVVLECIGDITPYNTLMNAAGYKMVREVMQDKIYVRPDVEAFYQEQQRRRR